MSSYNEKNNIIQEENKLPLSLFFLKSVIAGLGIMLVAGFVFVIGLLLLGGKYIAEKAEYQPYQIAKSITLSPAPQGEILDSKITPAGIEVLLKEKEQIILKLYSPQTGEELSNAIIK